MKITLTISDEQKNRLEEAFCEDYQENIQDPKTIGLIIPNPQTKSQFALSKIKKIIINYVRDYEIRKIKENISVTDIEII